MYNAINSCFQNMKQFEYIYTKVNCYTLNRTKVICDESASVLLTHSKNRGQPRAQNRETYKNDITHSLKSDQQEHPLLGPEQESELHHLLSVRFQRGYWSSFFVWFQINDYKLHHTKL